MGIERKWGEEKKMGNGRKRKTGVDENNVRGRRELSKEDK